MAPGSETALVWYTSTSDCTGSTTGNETTDNEATITTTSAVTYSIVCDSTSATNIYGYRANNAAQPLTNITADGADAPTTTFWIRWTTDQEVGRLLVNDSSSMVLPKSRLERFRDQIRANLSDGKVERIKRDSPAEIRAQGLLRELVGAKAFREYMTKGRLTVLGQTGLRYVLKPGHEMVGVFARDKTGRFRLLERLCVVFKDGRLPPTDAVVMRKLLIENDEFGFRSMGYVHSKAPTEEFDERQVMILRGRKIA